jgi:1,4-dihydroxy-2-naphthoyl-CoA hydrolase
MGKPYPMLTVDEFNTLGASSLPGNLGIVVLEIADGRVRCELAVREALMAPHGFLHAGTVVSLADTSAGYGCLASLPEGATSFTTLELKSNHLGTARDGVIECAATAVHKGRTTQVWDAVVTHRQSARTIALFRCTQMLLYAQDSRTG